ncbi:Gfo/Idh/MocA family oxidoreductase [Phytohabitans sp. ZYX-F-186]|uniref:Gfo/Idh/MocA family oxidoreductase n=1 Tax=Phytohabitans maris TaxID=3071409 RepID=A0ABU0ZK97_9ACTN|nr:Gfo/Idh/MocA family oxidoreductase [Phytohabitans sp. ZYX-F-186]MDQ7907403.1 Gfo/Idh/MocA family oxidoreductase [Phytohabitans sp. ZYX-F-186]
MRPPSSPEPLRFGLLGCADIAWRRVLPAMRADDSVRLVAVASRDPAKATRFAERFGAEAVVGYDALLERPDIDAVYLPLPPSLHRLWTARALAAGRHVLVEKPLTMRARHTAALYESAAALGLVLRENVMFVHHAQHSVVRTLVDGGAIGQVRSFSSTFAIPPRPSDDIRYEARLGGGALYDIAVYPIRAAMLLLRDPLSVVGAVLRLDRARRVVLSGSVLLRTPTGVAARLEFGMEHTYRTEYRLVGSAGRLTLDRAFSPPADHRPVVRIDRGGRIEEVTLAPDDQVANTIRAFRAAVLDGAARGGPVDAAVTQARLIDEVRARAEIVPV